MKKLFIYIILIFLLTSCTQEQHSINVNIDGKTETIQAETIYANDESITFPAVVRSSGSKPVETEYKGIELTQLFKSIGVDLSEYTELTFNASDGYRIILNVEEVMEPSNVYLTFQRDGELLKPKKQGGNGPFQLIIRRDPFSQRWIKHVDEIILK
jgi:hypothetical protein